MLPASQLLEEHENGFGGRPQRIKRLRSEFAHYCDLDVPRSAAAVEAWYSSKKGVITRRLRERTGYYDEEEGDSAS